jgi:hypothetical protein
MRIRNHTGSIVRVAMAAGLLHLAGGCATVKRAAMRSVVASLTGSGGANAFVTDDDPQLVRDALPFALKTFESLLAADPANLDLAAATAKGFVSYSALFVLPEASRLEASDLAAARAGRDRAKRLFLRGRDYGMAGLERRRPGFERRLHEDPSVLASLGRRDVPLLFWAAAGWAGAVSAVPSDMKLLADLAVIEAMMRRALELDESYEDGTLHEFFIAFEGGRSEAMGGSPERARRHFERAVELCGGRRASPYVALATTVAVKEQNYELFKDLLDKALAVDPDAVPAWRLVNTLAREQAHYLMEHRADLFLDYEEGRE